MVERKTSKEKRRHKRFKAYDNLQLFLDFYGEAVGQITDLSEGGIGFLYTGHKDWTEDLNKVDITTADYLFTIKDLPVRAVWESRTAREDSFLSGRAKRCGIQFRHLYPDQVSQLNDFIEIQASKAKYIEK